MKYARRAARWLTLFSAASPWTGATWATNGGGQAYNTPTLGSELLTNTEFTSDTTGWSAVSSATLTRRDFASSPNIAPTGGSDNLGIEVASSGTNTSAARPSVGAILVVTGQWYNVRVRAYAPLSNTATRAAYLQLINPANAILGRVSVNNAWETLLVVGLASTTAADFRLRCNSTTAGDLAHFDAPTLKGISTPTTLAIIVGSTSTATAAAKIHTITTGTQAGVVSLLDSASNPQNFLIGYHDGTNVRLDKCVGGTYTNLISTAVAFSSGAQIEIRRPSGNMFQLWYNGSQRGTDQTVSDAGIISNTRYGLFSTYSGNLFSEFSLAGVVIPLVFPGA